MIYFILVWFVICFMTVFWKLICKIVSWILIIRFLCPRHWSSIVSVSSPIFFSQWYFFSLKFIPWLCQKNTISFMLNYFNDFSVLIVPLTMRRATIFFCNGLQQSREIREKKCGCDSFVVGGLSSSRCKKAFCEGLFLTSRTKYSLNYLSNKSLVVDSLFWS